MPDTYRWIPLGIPGRIRPGAPSQMISILGRHAGRQARDGALVDIEKPRHRGLWLALVEQLESLLLLMPRQLRRPGSPARSL
jgi:hypothetical protein